jgi:hypothetical protein
MRQGLGQRNIGVGLSRQHDAGDRNVVEDVLDQTWVGQHLFLGEACLGQSLFDYVGYTLERKLERVLPSRYLQFSSFRV